MKSGKGLIQVYHGDGKGKTTAAFGLAMRAAGQGLKVCVIQFMKESVKEAGEVESAKSLKNITIKRFARSFIDRPAPKPEEIKERINQGLDFAEEAVSKGVFNVVILDEINVAIHLKVADVEKVLKVIGARAPDVELVLTGRYPPKEIIDISDLVTEMKMVKHPFGKGVQARKGIDF